MNVDQQRTDLHTSTGLCGPAHERVTAAFNYIGHDWINWLDADERKEIAKRIEREFFLPNIVGIMDGTLLKNGYGTMLFWKVHVYTTYLVCVV